ncbi:MAG: GGDEF domain-containing protein, partial [Candidatus Eremiobacterota bacterium]
MKTASTPALDEAALREFLELSMERDFPAGGILCWENSPGDCVFLILEGQVEVVKDAGGRERRMATRGAGELVGEMAALDLMPRSATVRAMEPVRARLMQQDDFWIFLDRCPQCAVRLLRQLSVRLRTMQEELLQDWLRELDQVEKARNQVGRLHQLNESLSHMARTDQLTGCYNRRYLKELLARLSESEQPFCLLIMDIDHFKHYNDSHGHVMGDQLLKGFADLVTSKLRGDDLLARYGGEEFVVVLPSIPYATAVDVAERIRAAVAEADFPHAAEQPLGSLSVSGGLARFP